jgi:glycosyltransferase involved in cell wall biosynthesis
MNPCLAIVIPTYNRAMLAMALVKSLSAYMLKNPRIASCVAVFVLDNASDDHASYAELATECQHLGFHYYRAIQNTGWTGNFSRAYIVSQDIPYLWILSDDDLVSEKALQLIVSIVQAASVDMIFFNSHLTTVLFSGYLRDWIGYAHETDFSMISANTLLSSVVFRRSLFCLERLWRYEGYWFPHSYSIYESAFSANANLLVFPSSGMLAESGNTSKERQSCKSSPLYLRLNNEFQRACFCFTNFCLVNSSLDPIPEHEYIERISIRFDTSPRVIQQGMQPIADILQRL